MNPQINNHPKPDRLPDFIANTKSGIKVNFWVIEVTNNKNAALMYQYENGAWDEFHASFCLLDDNVFYYNHYERKSINYNEWRQDESVDSVLTEAALHAAWEFYLVKLDLILTGQVVE
jgi:hypothetical protein